MCSSSSSASLACSRRLSSIVGRIPRIFTRGFRFSRIIVSVFSSWTRPRSDRYSHCTGTITPVARRERVDRQQAERRRRVDEDVVVVVHDRHQRLLERALAADHGRQRQLGAGQVDRRDGDVELAVLDDLLDRHAVHEHVEHRALDVLGIDAEAHRQVRLRVEVDDQDPEALLLQRGAEVDRRGRLGDPALLVREREDLRTGRRGAGHPHTAERGGELAGSGYSHRSGVSRHHRGILPR